MKYNKLYRWFLTLMLALPIISIAVRCIYVQKNPNAIESYGSNLVNDTNELLPNTNYQLVYNEDKIEQIDFSLYVNDTNLDEMLNLSSIIYRVRFTKVNNVPFMYYYTNDNTYGSYANWYQQFTSFTFNLNYLTGTTINGAFVDIYNLDNSTSKLDNAFEYSVSEFNNIGFDKLNFTRWFTDLFTNGDNIYTTFINSYCNYVLFSTCALALPYFLYWFITFVMGLMDRFGRKEIMR